MICPHCQYDDRRGGNRCGSCKRPLWRARPTTPPPFVGRTRALAALNEVLDGVLRNRAPAIVALVGPAGMGRSRLMERFWSRHDNEFSDVSAIRGYIARVDERHDGFRPFGRLLKNALGFDDTEAVDAQRQMVREAVRKLSPPDLAEALTGLDFFLRLGLVSPEDRGSAEDPGMIRRRAFAAMTWLLRQKAQQGPLMLLVEHLSSAPPEAISLLGYLRDHLVESPIMMLCEVDEETLAGEPAFFQRLGHAVLRLPPLERGHMVQLIQQMSLREASPPDNLVQVLSDVSEGNPERLRQGVRRMMEEGVIPPPGDPWPFDTSTPLEVDFPLTEEAAAHHRLDACDEQMLRWLTRAAVVGEVFWSEALIPLARVEQGVDEAVTQWIDLPAQGELDAILDALQGRHIIEPVGQSGHGRRFLFTDPAERVWLEAQLEEDARRVAHGVVAEWLESHMNLHEEHLSREVARHYAEGGNRHRAAFYYIQAGQGARNRFAHESAIEAYRLALKLLDDSDALALMDVQHALGTLYTITGRYPDAERAFRQMLIHAWVLDHRAKAGAALNRLGRLYRAQARYDQANSLLEQGRRLFLEADDGPGVASSLDDLGQVALRRENREVALNLFTEALDLRRRLKDPRSIAVSLTNLGRVQRDTGFLRIAEKTLFEALQIRLRIRDAVGVVTSHLALSDLYLYWAQWDKARESATSALERAREVGDRGQTAKAMTLLAAVNSAEGLHETGERQGRQAAALAEQLGDVRVQARARRVVALARRAEGDQSGAEEAIGPTLDLARRHQENYELAKCLHVRALVHMDAAGIDLLAAAEEAALAFDEQSDQEGEGASINRLIDEVLADEGTGVSSQVLALSPELRAELDKAREACQDALALLTELDDHLALIQLIHDAVPLLTALGEVERARSLAKQRGQLEATWRARTEQI
ncbi:MAG: ATP-binding protein [Bradymonadia bacterium]